MRKCSSPQASTLLMTWPHFEHIASRNWIALVTAIFDDQAITRFQNF